MGVNSKVADPSQNSYITINEASTYMSLRSDTDEWDNANATVREAALIQAANDLEIFNYRDDKYYDTQGLQFPRNTHTVVSGVCGTPVTATTFRHSNLYSNTYMSIPQDYWEEGSCHITSGTPVRDIRRITDSSATNGEITLATALSGLPDGNTNFIVFAPIQKEIKNAQCEQALYILKNPNYETVINYRNSGVKRVDIDDVRMDFHEKSGNRLAMCPEAKKLISRWLRKRLRMARR